MTMCGSIENVNNYPGLPGILSEAGFTPEQIADITGIRMSQKRELRPTDPVQALVPTRSGTKAMPATWWLKLDKSTLKPDMKWATFNCQSRRLLTSKLHSIPPRSYRSVVLAKGFFEWQPVYSGGRLYTGLSEVEKQKLPKAVAKSRHLIHKPGEVLFLAAMCKHRVDPAGEPLVSTGVITLPSHVDFLDIHHKSFPLILNQDELDA